MSDALHPKPWKMDAESQQMMLQLIAAILEPAVAIAADRCANLGFEVDLDQMRRAASDAALSEEINLAVAIKDLIVNGYGGEDSANILGTYILPISEAAFHLYTNRIQS